MTDRRTVRRALIAAGWQPDHHGSDQLRRGRAWWWPRPAGASVLHGEGYDGDPAPREYLPRDLTPAEAVERAVAFATAVLAANHAHWARRPTDTGDTVTDTLTARLIDAATAAGLVLAHAIDYANGHANVHVRPASMGEWQQWCDLVSVDGGSIRTASGGSFTYGVGSLDGTRITLYGHGVWALWDAERATSGRVAGPAHDTTGDA